MNKKRVIVIRHGMPEAHHKYAHLKMLKGSQLVEFINDWNSCELSQENVVPEALKQLVSESDYFISSALKRTIDSFRLLDITKTDSLKELNEAELPHGFLKNLVLPITVWSVVIRLLWVLGFRMISESYREFRLRIRKARVYIESRSLESDTIAVVAHGFVNNQLRIELKKNKWKHIQNCGGHDYWSFDIFEKG